MSATVTCRPGGSPWRLALAGLLTTVVLLGSTRLSVAADEPARKDEPRKEEPRRADSDDVQKQLDQMRHEMEQMREEMRRRFGQVGREFPGGTFVPFGPGFMPGGNRPSGRLGVRVDAPSEVLADQLDLKKGQGLVIQDVQPDSAAAKAGLKAHDVLVEFNGKPVPDDMREFARMVEEAKADTPIDATVVRKGKQETIKGISLPAVRPEGRPGGRSGSGDRERRDGSSRSS